MRSLSPDRGMCGGGGISDLGRKVTDDVDGGGDAVEEDDSDGYR